jgi:PIN domain nuclease of toxin-antitoxin system
MTKELETAKNTLIEVCTQAAAEIGEETSKLFIKMINNIDTSEQLKLATSSVTIAMIRIKEKKDELKLKETLFKWVTKALAAIIIKSGKVGEKPKDKV